MSADLHGLAASGALIACIGYGSLVNVKTHRTPSIGSVPIQLKGWRRQWCLRGETGAMTPALLSGVECSDSQIDALLVYDYATSLPALDQREVFYDRLEVTRAAIGSEVPLIDCPTYIYRAQDVTPAKPQQNFLIQSYLDAVLQGHAMAFGHGAIERFIETTDNWSLPLNRDRHAPIYPRPVVVDAQEATLFDQQLEWFIQKS